MNLLGTRLFSLNFPPILVQEFCHKMLYKKEYILLDGRGINNWQEMVRRLIAI